LHKINLILSHNDCQVLKSGTTSGCAVYTTNHLPQPPAKCKRFSGICQEVYFYLSLDFGYGII